MKKVLILGGGGFIGGHLAKRLKDEGHWVRVVDIKNHEYFKLEEFCDEFVLGDLKDATLVSKVMLAPNQTSLTDHENSFDEVYQFAADMGGAGYIFTGENDFNVMHNSCMINLNVVEHAIKFGVKKLFYSSSACMYPEHNQLDPNNPNCEESSAYPANPDSEYGWEKLFSERLYLTANRNYNLNVRIARFHNIFGPQGTWKGGKEKAPAAMCRKVAETQEGGEIEVWGDGKQTRSFLYVDECIEAVLKLMDSDFIGPVNIGSEEMVTINELAQMAIDISGKNIKIKNIYGDEFVKKYGHKCPLGVKGRNSDNRLYKEKIGWSVSEPLINGLAKTYQWIEKMNLKNKFAIVVQGPASHVEELKKAWDGFNIIWSTWIGEENKFNSDDIVIFNEYPKEHGVKNLGLQMTSTLEGIKKAKKLGFKHVLKWRSDLIPNNPIELVNCFKDNHLNFLAWHIEGQYFIDYFLAGDIDDVYEAWDLNTVLGPFPERLVTDNIFDKNFKNFNFIGNDLSESNEIYWIKYNVYLSSYNGHPNSDVKNINYRNYNND